MFAFALNNHVSFTFLAKWSHDLCAVYTCIMLQINRLKALWWWWWWWWGHKQQPNETKAVILSEKGASLCVVYIMKETLCGAIRKIMSSHVNDRSVCRVQNECPLICKAFLLREWNRLHVWKSSEDRDATQCGIEQTALFILFSPFLSFSSFLPPFGSLDTFPSLLRCPGPSPAPGRPEDEWLFLTLEDGRD